MLEQCVQGLLFLSGDCVHHLCRSKDRRRDQTPIELLLPVMDDAPVCPMVWLELAVDRPDHRNAPILFDASRVPLRGQPSAINIADDPLTPNVVRKATES